MNKSNNSLYIYTDGSLKNQFGGYGIFLDYQLNDYYPHNIIIDQMNRLNQNIILQKEMSIFVDVPHKSSNYNNNLQMVHDKGTITNKIHSTEYDTITKFVSRCYDISYVELPAIPEILSYLLLDPNKYIKFVDEICIITDNQQTFKWISGIDTINEP